MMKKIGALVLAIVMIAMVGLAFADPVTIGTGTGTTAGTGAAGAGEIGGYVEADKQAQGITKSVRIAKEITAYNPDKAYVYGPAITYTYAIATTSGDELVKITDATTDHTSKVATTVTALPGLTTNVTMTGTEANKIAWTNSDILNTSATGTPNYKYLTIDFSNVAFDKGPGVYRYKITESTTYTNTGVTDGSISAIRYLDVYVMRSANFDATHDGTTGHEYVAADWDIYGYVCIGDADKNTNITPTMTTKTNGFVDGDATSSHDSYADEYYTYNFTVTKDLVGDDTMIDHQFPMTVVFSGGPTGTFQLIAETDGAKSTLTTTEVAAGAETVNSASGVSGASATTAAIKKVGSAVALASFANAGAPKVADGNTTAGTTVGYIKYIGIPNTMVVTVTETNDVTGTTYTATVKEDVTTDNGSALVATTFTASTGILASENAIASIDTDETATRAAATNGNADTIAKNIQVEFTNTLAIISPTGYVARIAPYALILIAGIVLLIVAKRRKPAKEEE
jgi:hypothetical protein